MTSGAAVERAIAGRDDPAGAIVPSAAALAANARLEELRRAAGVVTRPALDQGQGAKSAASTPRPSPADRGQAMLEARRRELGINYRPPTVEGAAWSAWAADFVAAGLDQGQGGAGDVCAQTIDQAAGAGLDQLAGVTATVYPRLAAAILQAGQAAGGRLWLLLLASDLARRGAHDLNAVYTTFAGQGSAWHVGGRRRLQQILKAGRGIFWTIDRRGRLWRYGPARVGAALGLVGGVGAPQAVPVADLLGGMHSVRAALFAAALAAHDDPIGQRILEGLTSVCPNSQRAYRQTAGVEARPQYRFLPGAADRPALQDAHWRHGRGVFLFTDYNGQQGHGRGALLLVKRDPNAYTAALKPAQWGRTKKINRRLNLVTKGARGNGPAVDYQRFYFHDAAAAGSAYNRERGRREMAYRLDQGQGPGRVGLWGTIAALPGAGL